MEYIERVIDNDVTHYVTLQGILGGWVQECILTLLRHVFIFITCGVGTVIVMYGHGVISYVAITQGVLNKEKSCEI